MMAMTNSLPLSHEQALEEQGWIRRFTAVGQRLREAVRLYDELGFEVHLEPATPTTTETAGASACEDCLALTMSRTIYTRPRTSGLTSAASGGNA